MGITDTQSYSLVIRDAFFDAVSTDPFFASYTCRKTRMLAVKTELLPHLGVYIIDETMLPDGEPNAGVIRFNHDLRIGFSVMVANNDQVLAEQTIDAAFWKIMNRLWPDQHLMNMIYSSMADNTRVEAITRGARRHVFGASGLNNETPLAEMQYDITAKYRTYWPPIITDDLLEIDVTTQVGDPPPDQRPPIASKYLFDISRKRESRK